MSDCRICGAGLKPFMSFGPMPIANGFLTPEDFDGEYFFDLEPALCESCGMVQIVEQPAPELMFHADYAFFSGTSQRMAQHFKALAGELIERNLTAKDAFAVELGSNDGIMLRHIADAGIRHLGIEPSANVADAAREAGVNTLTAFFDEACAERIVDEYGHADVIYSANVMCHIPDLPGVAAGVRRLLKPDGLLIFEDPYLGDVIAKTSYDQIYDEHVFLFSATSVARAFAPHGLSLIDTRPLPTHGGSMRYYLAPKGSYPAAPAVETRLEAERQQGLTDPARYESFREACERSRRELLAALGTARDEGGCVVGYGATAKSTTVTNYCGITSDLVSFISDITPEKQGKYSPGVHIPVRPYDAFRANYPDYALLFAWNHEAEIRDKEQDFAASGGRWIRYVPEVEILA